MPTDTAWYGSKGSYLFIDSGQTSPGILIIQNVSNDVKENFYYSYNPQNSDFADKILKNWIKNNRGRFKTEFDIEKEYYDKLGDKFSGVIFIAFILFIFYAKFKAYKKKNNLGGEDDNAWIEIGTRSINYFEEVKVETIRRPSIEFLTYKGKDLNFSTDEITAALNKRFPYFTKLSTSEKHRFLQRHKKFMSRKLFRIYDKSGFKEMPILISATAIQLSFGLEEYLLPHYKNINIFPQEFLGIEPHIRFLEGNVSGNTINISWKHFLQGYENLDNGQNVGLHEMAHAYYCQNMICEDDKDHKFASSYGSFDKLSNQVFTQELKSADKLYTNYGLRNLQEFWAESVEIFFERPISMMEQYPELYSNMKQLLNQAPA